MGEIQSFVVEVLKHNFDDIAQLHIFYNGLKPQTKMILDALAGGTVMSKSLEEAIVIIDSIVASGYQSHHYRAGHSECNSSSK